MGDELFAATRWTVVIAAARQENDGPAIDALTELCQCYWPPLYAYIRRQGCSTQEAEDFTQEFFSRLLEKNYLADLDRGKGKFRSFLLASLKNFLANERDRSRAQKRGGGHATIALDSLSAEARARLEPVDHLSPDKAFERQWAMTVLDHALGQLRNEYAESGRERLFEELKECLTGAFADSSSAIAERCGLSEGALKVAVHRLRRRYREVLRNEIAQTVTAPEEIEGEIRYLFSIFEHP